jgi:RND superfamily putative drug exporter
MGHGVDRARREDTGFLAFATGSISFLQQFGLGAGLAMFIDAILIRGILAPASMAALGRMAWWAPGPLRWMRSRLALTD